MIDLSALGLSNVQTPHGGKRDKASASPEHGKESKNFGDLINEAGKKNGKKHETGDHASTGKGIDVSADEWTDTDELPIDKLGIDKRGIDKLPTIDKLAAIDDIDGAEPADFKGGMDLTDAFFDSEEATDDGQKAGGRVRLSAAFQQLMKSAVAGDKVADTATETNAIDARPEIKSTKSEKLKKAEAPENSAKAENAAGGKSIPDDLTAPEEDTDVSPSRELHALLSLTPKKDDAEEEAADAPAIEVQQHDTGNDPVVITKPAHAAETVGAEIKAEAKADTAVQQAVAQQQVTQQAVMQTIPKASSEKPAQADADDAQRPVRNDNDVVRVVSNDGKGRPVDIELAKVGADDSAEPATSGKVDFVTVLDSRRYLGFSTDGASNASTLTNAIKAEPSWAQVIHKVNTGADRTATEVNTLKLQMNPEHMGNMTASLRLKGDELSVEVRVETVDAYRQLSKDQDSIVKALKDQGFTIDQVTIQLSPSAKADGGQNSSQNSSGQNSGNQQGSDQNLQQGGQGDNARQRDESARRNANQNNWNGNDKTSSFNDSGSSTDDANSGNLYL